MAVSVILFSLKSIFVKRCLFSCFNKVQNSINPVFSILFLDKFNFFIVLLPVSLFKLLASSIIPLFKILFELKFNAIKELFFAIPLDKIVHPSSPILLLLIFNLAKEHFSSDNNSTIFLIPS